MKIALLRKEHERALNYLTLIETLNNLVTHHMLKYKNELKKDHCNKFLFHSESHFLCNIIKYDSLLLFCEKRYGLVMKRIFEL